MSRVRSYPETPRFSLHLIALRMPDVRDAGEYPAVRRSQEIRESALDSVLPKQRGVGNLDGVIRALGDVTGRVL